MLAVDQTADDRAAKATVPGGKDDMANALAGVANLIVLAERQQNTGAGVATYGTVIEQCPEPEPIAKEDLPKTPEQVCSNFMLAWKAGGNRGQIVESLREYRRLDGSNEYVQYCKQNAQGNTTEWMN